MRKGLEHLVSFASTSRLARAAPAGCLAVLLTFGPGCSSNGEGAPPSNQGGSGGSSRGAGGAGPVGGGGAAGAVGSGGTSAMAGGSQGGQSGASGAAGTGGLGGSGGSGGAIGGAGGGQVSTDAGSGTDGASNGGAGSGRDAARPLTEAGPAQGRDAGPATCSDSVLRTAPPMGKEAFKTEPVDMRFPFAQHWMGTFSADPRFIGMTSFGDFDNDGDLDFSSGQREDVGGGMVWWEYCSPDHWVRHAVGTGHSSWAGGYSVDIDNDGWVDLIAGTSWYRNPHTPRTTGWQRYPIGTAGRPEEIIVGEVTGDTRPDVLFVHLSFAPQYWSPAPFTAGTVPMTWTLGTLATARPTPQQQGGAMGDIDGDGLNDILVGYRWWYRNVGNGASWQTVEIFPAGTFDDSPLTYLGDLDGDGDTDFVMATHFGARLAWAENRNGLGTQFAIHMISTNKTFLHTVIAADFDNDGDLDILAANNVGAAFIFDNTDGKGTFTEHQIVADSRGHDMRVGDVDCDGDLDIAGTPWGDLREGGESATIIRDQVYVQNMLVERGGRPLFQRHPYEVFLGAQSRVCPGSGDGNAL